jgi:hypothetical protein
MKSVDQSSSRIVDEGQVCNEARRGSGCLAKFNDLIGKR